MKKTEKPSFKLAIPLNFEMLTTQLDLVAQSIVLGLDYLIISLFLKFMDVVEILLVNNYKVLEFKK